MEVDSNGKWEAQDAASEIRPESPWLRRFPLRSPTLPPATHTNAYLYGEGELLLVDPGSPQESENERLLDGVDELMRDGHRVTAIFLTHHHYDHTSGAAYLQRRLAVPILAHELTAERLRPQGLLVQRTIQDSEVLAYGGRGAGSTALHTPGHAPGHLCLLDGAGAGLIAGDMVASVGTILVSPWDGGDMGAYEDSLLRLLRLSQDRVHAAFGATSASLRLWPAHGASIAEGAEWLTAYLSHRRQREERVLEALQKGAATASALVRAVYADKPGVDPLLAQGSLLAHLYKLHRQGRVFVQDDVWSLAN